MYSTYVRWLLCLWMSIMSMVFAEYWLAKQHIISQKMTPFLWITWVVMSNIYVNHVIPKSEFHDRIYPIVQHTCKSIAAYLCEVCSKGWGRSGGSINPWASRPYPANYRSTEWLVGWNLWGQQGSPQWSHRKLMGPWWYHVAPPKRKRWSNQLLGYIMATQLVNPGPSVSWWT